MQVPDLEEDQKQIMESLAESSAISGAGGGPASTGAHNLKIPSNDWFGCLVSWDGILQNAEVTVIVYGF